MRKVEEQMVSAILERRNWSGGNTSVSYEEGNQISRVYLHGNLIALVGEKYIQLYDGNYQTKTTKSRLNAILQKCGDSDRIYQKNFDWYISTNDGDTLFESGMILW